MKTIRSVFRNTGILIFLGTGVAFSEAINVPTATAPSAPTVAEDDVNVALADNIQVTDLDGDAQTVTFTVTGGTVRLGTAGISFGGGGNGSANFTATGTLTAINAALDAATFTPTPDLNGTNAGSISFTSFDGTSTSSVVSVTFDISSVPDNPVANYPPGTVSWTEGTPPVIIRNSITISDADGDNITTGIVRTTSFTTPSDFEGDILSAAAPGPYSQSFDSNTGTLTLSGTGTAAQMQAALRSVGYSNSGDNPSIGNRNNVRRIRFWVTDATGLTSSRGPMVFISINSLNDAPTLSCLPSDISVLENTASDLDLSAATFEDVDAGRNSVVLTIVAAQGALTATTGGGGVGLVPEH